MFKLLKNFIKHSSLSLVSLIFTGLIIFSGFYFYILIGLPDVNQLKDATLQIPLRIYSNDGKLISEFGEKKRSPVEIDQVPTQLINAVLDTEDQRFYEHRGVDFLSLIRALIAFVETGKKSQGASTITMQVARNYFLTRQKTFARKLNEILLAFKIDNSFSKKEILELYLNKIYFGNRAYGVAAAAQVYYGKKLEDLNIDEMAMLAGLPQAPSRDNPIVNPKAAFERRNHVLQRMLENDHVTLAEYNLAVTSPISAKYHEAKIEVFAPYAAEMVRAYIIEQYGDNGYDAGLKVYTTIDPHLQKTANNSLRNGILAYDQRHEYRGPEGNLEEYDQNNWATELKSIQTVNGLQPAAVLSFNDSNILALLSDDSTINISHKNFSWADQELTEQQLNSGDIIRVYKNRLGEWRLAQLPKIEGGIVSLDPKTGAILAICGGFSYTMSNFNRIIQAERQTGSIFKPFIYSAALDKGFTLASVINDSPIVLMDPSTNSLWRPQNDSQTFYGPTRIRTALIMSRNLVSIRLLQMTGIDYTINYLKNFGFKGAQETPPALSLALGSGVTTPLKMAAAYAVFANGGYKTVPFIISSIVKTATNIDDEIIFQSKPPAAISDDNITDNLPKAKRVISAENAYLITDALKSALTATVTRKKINLNRKDLAGKTGTTNDQIDGWYAGYNSDLITTVWIGFDQPQSTNEYGVNSAMPIWVQFMKQALAGKPEHTMQRPETISNVRIDPTTGLLANPEQKNAIFEIFDINTVPKEIAPKNSSTTEEQKDKIEAQEEMLF